MKFYKFSIQQYFLPSSTYISPRATTTARKTRRLYIIWATALSYNSVTPEKPHTYTHAYKLGVQVYIHVVHFVFRAFLSCPVYTRKLREIGSIVFSLKYTYPVRLGPTATASNWLVRRRHAALWLDAYLDARVSAFSSREICYCERSC